MYGGQRDNGNYPLTRFIATMREEDTLIILFGFSLQIWFTLHYMCYNNMFIYNFKNPPQSAVQLILLVQPRRYLFICR